MLWCLRLYNPIHIHNPPFHPFAMSSSRHRIAPLDIV
jgi:hypothetical protein